MLLVLVQFAIELLLLDGGSGVGAAFNQDLEELDKFLRYQCIEVAVQQGFSLGIPNDIQLSVPVPLIFQVFLGFRLEKVDIIDFVSLCVLLVQVDLVVQFPLDRIHQRIVTFNERLHIGKEGCEAFTIQRVYEVFRSL